MNTRERWMQRYGDDYATDEGREEGYRLYRETLAEMRGVFGETPNPAHVVTPPRPRTCVRAPSNGSYA